jgi:hypothetical protein
MHPDARLRHMRKLEGLKYPLIIKIMSNSERPIIACVASKDVNRATHFQ